MKPFSKFTGIMAQIAVLVSALSHDTLTQYFSGFHLSDPLSSSLAYTVTGFFVLVGLASHSLNGDGGKPNMLDQDKTKIVQNLNTR